LLFLFQGNGGTTPDKIAASSTQIAEKENIDGESISISEATEVIESTSGNTNG
jgi:hypothetical protein